MDELRLRFRLFADDLAFLHEMDLDIEVLQRHVIAEVPIQPVGLFHEDRATARALLEEADHFAELFPSGALRGFNVGEFTHNLKAMLLAILPQKLALGGN